jgi:hypothetical protein
MTGTEIATAKPPHTVREVMAAGLLALFALGLLGACTWGLIWAFATGVLTANAQTIVAGGLMSLCVVGAAVGLALAIRFINRQILNQHRAGLAYDAYVGLLPNSGVKAMPSTGHNSYLCVIGNDTDQTIQVEQRQLRVIVHARGEQATSLARRVRDDIGGDTIKPWLVVA